MFSSSVRAAVARQGFHVSLDLDIVLQSWLCSRHKDRRQLLHPSPFPIVAQPSILLAFTIITYIFLLVIPSDPLNVVGYHHGPSDHGH